MSAYSSFIVILENVIEDENAQNTINAIKQIKGVIDVKPFERNSVDEYVAATRVRYKLWDKISQVFAEEFKQ